MTYPNEPARGLKDPGKYPKFRRGTWSYVGKACSTIFGIIRSGRAASGGNASHNPFALIFNALKRWKGDN